MSDTVALYRSLLTRGFAAAEQICPDHILLQTELMCVCADSGLTNSFAVCACIGEWLLQRSVSGAVAIQ